jgi:hypothetical protein
MRLTEPVAERVLRVAVQVSQGAPSIFNTQPWSWQINGGTLQLHADRSRQLTSNDPDGRLLVVSCGTALHYALLTLVVMGREVGVQRVPDPAEPDLLAVIDLDGAHDATPPERYMYAAIDRRRTDRRPFSTVPVPTSDLRLLVDAAEQAGAHLHLIREDDVAAFAAIAEQASAIQLSDPRYHTDLASWVTPSGVPADTVVPPVERRVPVRDFAPSGGADLEPGMHSDAAARWAVVFTDGDAVGDWLRAGEALSAVLLTATAAGLAAAPISDVTETTATRERLRHMLSRIGYPQIGVRVGYPPVDGVPESPRRPVRDVIS